MTPIVKLAGSRSNPAAAVFRALTRRSLWSEAEWKSKEDFFFREKKYYADYELDLEYRNLYNLVRDTYYYMTRPPEINPERDALSLLAVRAMKAGRINDSFTFLNKMPSLGMLPDVTLYDYLISICGKSKRLDLAVKLQREMKRLEVKPTAQTFMCLLHACASTGRLDRVSAIIRDMAEAGLGLNEFCYAGMITAHLNHTPQTDDISSKIIDIVEQSKGGSQVYPRPVPEGGISEEELYNLPTADYVNCRYFLLNRQIPVYHVAFNALAELGDVQATNKLLEMLRNYGDLPDTYVRIQIMRCYLYAGDLDRGLKVFEDCKRLNVQACPDIHVALAEGAMFGYTPRGMQIAQETLVYMNTWNLVPNLKSADDLLLIAAGEKTGGYTTANLIWDILQAFKLEPSLPAVNAYYNGLRGRDIAEDDPRLKLVAQTRDKLRRKLGYVLPLFCFISNSRSEVEFEI